MRPCPTLADWLPPGHFSVFSRRPSILVLCFCSQCKLLPRIHSLSAHRIPRYYTRDEQPLRMGIWIGSAGLGYVISGIASFGIGHINASLENWKLIFLIWGAITTAWGLVLIFLLPGSPLKTKFLTNHERALALNRVKVNNTGIENKEFKMKQFYEALSDMKTWLLFLFAVASNSPNGGLTTVRPNQSPAVLC
jgi:MFS family permease